MSLFCLLQIRRMGRRGQQLVLAVHPVSEGLRERLDEAPLGARGGRDPRDAEAGSGGGGGALDGAGGYKNALTALFTMTAAEIRDPRLISWEWWKLLLLGLQHSTVVDLSIY